MKREELQQLIQAYQDGELKGSDARRLAAVIRQPGPRSDLAMAEIRLSGLLAEALSTVPEDAVARSVLERLNAQETEDSFVERFEKRRARLPENPRRRPATGLFPAGRSRAYPARSWRITAAAAAVLALLGAATVMQWRRIAIRAMPTQLAHVADVHNDVRLLRADSQQPLRTHNAVLPGDTIAVPAEGHAVVIYPDGTELALYATARISFEPPHIKNCHLFLALGTADLSIAPRSRDRSLVLRTPHARITVLGTRFTVHVSKADTRVEVAKGLVEVAAVQTGHSAKVARGQTATVTHAVRLATHQPPRRVKDGLLALYTFSGTRTGLIRDVAGVDAPLPLYVEPDGNTVPLPGGGIALRAPSLIASKEPAFKITAACLKTEELSVETWIRPENLYQGGGNRQNWLARIVTVSQDPGHRNFTLGQVADRYGFRLRTTTTGENGVIPDAGRWANFGVVRSPANSVRLEQTHVVATRTAQGEVSLYVNGRRVHSRAVGGSLENWAHEFPLALGREFRNNFNSTELRPWLGDIYLVALYSRALEPAEIAQNFKAGPNNTATAQR